MSCRKPNFRYLYRLVWRRNNGHLSRECIAKTVPNLENKKLPFSQNDEKNYF